MFNEDNIQMWLVHVMAHSEKHFDVQTHYNLYIDVGRLISSFQCDPDLASLPQSELVLQLYAVTGCDYTSFVSGISKATFLIIFFQHADFITTSYAQKHRQCKVDLWHESDSLAQHTLKDTRDLQP